MRCQFLVCPPQHTTTEVKLAAAEGTFAYCGRYEIDAKNNASSIYLKLPQDAALKDRARSGRISSKMAAWC
jgi:hypothetical protein